MPAEGMCEERKKRPSQTAALRDTGRSGPAADRGYGTGKCYHPDPRKVNARQSFPALARPHPQPGAPTVTADERRSLIARYAGGVAAVEQALGDFSERDLTAHPIPGKWSAAEIIHHLADSETTSAIRLRKLLVEEHAVIQSYDEAAFARLLHYNDRPIAPSLEAFRAARLTTLQLLERMSEDDWKREGWHTESGRYGAEHWLEIYAQHAHGHAGQIQRLKEALGRG